MNPKNVNEVCSCEPRRVPSLQYTIRGLGRVQPQPHLLHPRVGRWTGKIIAREASTVMASTA